MREAHDARRQALLVAVKLADLDLGADLGMGDVEPRECDPYCAYRHVCRYEPPPEEDE